MWCGYNTAEFITHPKIVEYFRNEFKLKLLCVSFNLYLYIYFVVNATVERWTEMDGYRETYREK